MLTRVPDYFEQFRCLAGACPRSCCVGWEVVIDPDTAAAYRALPGPFGDRLRAALRRDADGGDCFPLAGGRCPFLDREDLCEIHRRLGGGGHQRHLPGPSPLHRGVRPLPGDQPGGFLSGGGPAAAGELGASDIPGGGSAGGRPEPGDPWLEPLLAARDRMFRLLTDRTKPLRRRLADLLDLALAAQDLLDEDRAEDLPALAESFAPADGEPPAEGPGLFPGALDPAGRAGRSWSRTGGNCSRRPGASRRNGRMRPCWSGPPPISCSGTG